MSIDGQERPVVGMAATICYHTDRRAATVVAVSANAHKVTVREDRAVRMDNNGMDECQRYEYSPDPDGRVHVFHLRRGGYRGSGKRLLLGIRNSYHDYSF